MIERVVSHSSAGPLLGGLDWRPAANGEHSTRSLHEAKSHTDSTHFAVLHARGVARYGLYKPRPSEELHKLPKGTLSAAACFAMLVGADAPNAALVLPVDSTRDREEQKYLVVVLDDGVPYIDAVVTEVAARDTIGSEERPMWAYSSAKYPNCEVVDYEWLATAGSKGTKVLAIPMNPWPALMLLVLVLVAGGSFWLYQKSQKAQEAQRLAQAAAALDPTPKYLEALAKHSAQAATRREDVVTGLQQLLRQAVVIPGWTLLGVECNVGQQRCLHRWARWGGTLDDIRQALPGHELILLNGPSGSEIPLLDMAATLVPWPVRRGSLASVAPKLPHFDEAMQSVYPLLQVWSNAGLKTDLKPARLWPQLPALAPNFSHRSAVRSGQFSVSDVPGALMQEVIESAPAWVQWETLSVELGDVKDARRLRFKITGLYYVSFS